MPRLASQNKQIKDERRQSIASASLIAFALYGKDNVTVEIVSKFAKCSHGLFYHYFKDIDSLYESVLSSKLVKETKERILRTDKIFSFQKLEQITTNILDVLSNDKNNAPVVAVLLDDDTKDSLVNALEVLISKGQKEGDVTGGDPKDIITTFAFIFKGYCSSFLTHKRNKPNLPDKDIVLELFRRRSRI